MNNENNVNVELIERALNWSGNKLKNPFSDKISIKFSRIILERLEPLYLDWQEQNKYIEYLQQKLDKEKVTYKGKGTNKEVTILEKSLQELGVDKTKPATWLPKYIKNKYGEIEHTRYVCTNCGYCGVAQRPICDECGIEMSKDGVEVE